MRPFRLKHGEKRIEICLTGHISIKVNPIFIFYSSSSKFLTNHSYSDPDTKLELLKECAEYIVAESSKLLTKCFDRFRDVYRNTEISGSTEFDLYRENELSRWFGSDAAFRLVIVQKCFLRWAHGQGILPSDRETVKFPDEELSREKVDRLVRFTVFWAFALALPPLSRKAFSTELQNNILGQSDSCDYTAVYINTEGQFEWFADLVDYRVPSFHEASTNPHVPSLELLQGKWLMGIFTADDRAVLCPSLQITGPDQSGKNHLLSYYGLDHPKSKTIKVVPGRSHHIMRAIPI